MKTKTILIIVLLIFNFSFAQTKKDLIQELESYIVNTTYNKNYDVEKEKLFQALIVVGNQRYGSSIKENLNKGYIEFASENKTHKEFLGIEIIGDQKPYKLIINLKTMNRRIIDFNGNYSNWNSSMNTNQDLIKHFHFKIWTEINGPVIFPPELMEKIRVFNDSQTKDKNRILKGKDY